MFDTVEIVSQERQRREVAARGVVRERPYPLGWICDACQATGAIREDVDRRHRHGCPNKP